MDPHQDVKLVLKDRIGERSRISFSPEHDGRRVKPKYDMDVRILICIVCKDQLSPPVCQCKNNHMACQICCKTGTKGQCPKCFQPIGRTRNKAIEEMIASLRVPCKHALSGCKKTLEVTNRKHHEQYECGFLLLDCPLLGCRFTSCVLKYSSHVEHPHKDARIVRHNESEELLTFGAFNMDSRDEFVLLKACPELFLLHQDDNILGQMLYVTSCGKDKRYSIEVVILNEHQKGPKTFKTDTMTSSVKTSSSKDFLLIPKQFIHSSRLPLSARCTVIIPQD